jgi:Na+-translocating ferredoxin:NAD+ oxidoreductase RnfA subunit
MYAIRQRERKDPMGFIWWLLIVALWVIFLSVTMSIARSKGHSPLLWGLLAVFLPVITLIIVLLLPNRALA